MLVDPRAEHAQLDRGQQDEHIDDVHVDLAVDLLKAMYTKERTGEAEAAPADDFTEQ